MAVCQNLVPLVNIKIAGKWMFIPLKMLLIGIDPYPYILCKLPIFRPHDPDLTSPPCPSAHRLSHDGGEWIHGPTQRHPVRCFD